jgi:membrane-associated HD superfamily phosphohydrolase
MRDLMKFDILLPFESRLIKTSKSKDEIINIFSKEKLINNFLIEKYQTLHIDLERLDKLYKVKIKDDKIHLWKNDWLRNSHAYHCIEFIEINKNEVTVKIFSRNRLLEIILYIVFMIVGIIGIIINLMFFSKLGFFIIITLMLFNFLLFSFAPKYHNNVDIKYFIKLMK